MENQVGAVVALHLKPAPGESIPVSKLDAVMNKGISGDRYFGKSSRQVLIISTDVLVDRGYEFGDLSEHITVDFDGLHQLKPGTRLKIGQVEFQLEQLCQPCASMANRLGENPKDFVQTMMNERGIFAVTMNSGEIRVGDTVSVNGG